MDYKKSLLVFCVIICILFTVSAAAAADVNDTAIASEDSGDIIEQTNDNQVISSADTENEQIAIEENVGELSDDALAIEEDNADTLSINQKDVDTVISNDVAKDKQILTTQNSDKDILSASAPKKVKIDIIKQVGKSPKNVKIYFKITNAKTGKPVYVSNDGLIIRYDIEGLKHISSVSTNSKGIGVFNEWPITDIYGFDRVVDFSLKLSVDSIWGHSTSSNVAKTTVKLVIPKENILPKQKATFKPTKLSTTYQSGKYFKVKVVDSKTKKGIPYVLLNLKVFTGKKYKKVSVSANSKGIAKYAASKLGIGKHKIVITPGNDGLIVKSKTSYVKISKAKLKIQAPKVTNAYKSGKFKVTVKNKKTGNPMSGVKVKIKVFTGKKYKTYKVKTNSKGVATISTKSLSKTTHKVVVSVKGTSKYKSASKKSSIKVVSSVKLKTHFKVKNVRTKVIGGELVSFKADVYLFDQNGNKLTKKVISAQLFGIDTRFYPDTYTVPISDVQKQDLTKPVEITPNRGDEISGVCLELKFSGDKKYKGCSERFN